MNKVFKKFMSVALAAMMALSCVAFASAEEAATVVKYGDITADDAINSSDALAALKHSVGSAVLEGDAFTAADVNGDSQVNSSDALLILQYSVGNIKIFPLEVKVQMPQTKAEILALYTKTIKEAREEVPAYKIILTSKATDVEISGSATSFMSKEDVEAEKERLMKESRYQNIVKDKTALANLLPECKITDVAKFKDITCKQLDNGNYQIDITFKDEKDPKAGSPIVSLLNLPDKATVDKTMKEELEATTGNQIPASVTINNMEYRNCSISCVIDVRTGEFVSINTTADTVISVTSYILIYSMVTDTTTRTVTEYSNFIY